MKKIWQKFIVAGLLSGLFLMAVCTGCAPENPPQEPSAWRQNESEWTDLSVREATGKNGVVASANAYASKAGLAVLEAGGNAFDASVATAFALGVVEPYASGVGGGGVMTAYNAKTQKYVFYNFREFTPKMGTAANFTQAGGTAALKEGITSVGVPTEVAGLVGIYNDLGSGNLSLADVMAPAIDYAENGFTVESTLATQLRDGLNNFHSKDVQEAVAIFGSDEYGIDPYGTGDVLKQTNYAKVLKEIASKGTDGFYKGWVADAIVKSMIEQNGFITKSDLTYAQEHYPIVSEPLHTNYENTYDIYTAGIPSSGGIILIETLNMLEAYCKDKGITLASLGNNTTEYLHLLLSAMQLSYADKRKYIADDAESPITDYVSPITGTSKFVNVPLQGLMSKEYASQRILTQFKEDSSYPLTSSYDFGGADRSSYSGYGYVADSSPWEYNDVQSAAATLASEEGDEHWSTTSFSVADKEGNIVSYTQTINHFWGAYVIPEGCGFFLNNQLSSFSLTQGNIHYVQPYAQPVSHIMPTIIMKNGKPYATVGSPGSTRIPSAVIQIALNLMDFGMGIQEAINNPRAYTYCTVTTKTDDNYDGWSSASANEAYLPFSERTKRIWLETTAGAQNAITPETVSALVAKGYNAKTYSSASLFFGGVQGIVFDYEGGTFRAMTGGADPRRDGKALAY